jgi:hypothetical protein
VRRNTVPLLKPPGPQVPKRKYYLRIEEPLTLTLERYAQFIGASSVDHVIAQALQFVFRKDTECRDWLDENPAEAYRLTRQHRQKTNATSVDSGKASEPIRKGARS